MLPHHRRQSTHACTTRAPHHACSVVAPSAMLLQMLRSPTRLRHALAFSDWASWAPSWHEQPCRRSTYTRTTGWQPHQGWLRRYGVEPLTGALRWLARTRGHRRAVPQRRRRIMRHCVWHAGRSQCCTGCGNGSPGMLCDWPTHKMVFASRTWDAPRTSTTGGCRWHWQRQGLHRREHRGCCNKPTHRKRHYVRVAHAPVRKTPTTVQRGGGFWKHRCLAVKSLLRTAS